MKYYLIAGEASGDLHAGNLMKQLKAQDSNAEFRFIGGENMQSAGGTMVNHYKNLAYMGFIPVLMHLRTILSNMEACKKDIAAWKPDVLILVDYPGFNLQIAEYIHAKKVCPVYYYISPKIWAWKEYRIKNIRRDVDEMFSILPFEQKWFAERNYNIHYVGNPCVDAVEEYRGKVNPTKTIAILAGSRKQEIKDNLPMMLQAASAFDGYRLKIAGAPNISKEFYDKYIPEGMNVELQFGRTYEILCESSAALVTSGTATLETALLKVPQVVCYYTPIGKVISYLRSKVLKVPYISLVNLIAGREVVRELVADGMKTDNIISALSDILPGGKGREEMLSDYDSIYEILGGIGASRKAATEIVRCMKNLN